MRKYIRIGIALVVIGGVVAAIFALRGQLGQPVENAASEEEPASDSGEDESAPGVYDDPVVVDAGDTSDTAMPPLMPTHPVDAAWTGRSSTSSASRTSGFGDIGAGPLRSQTPAELPEPEEDEATTAGGFDLPPIDETTTALSMPNSTYESRAAPLGGPLAAPQADTRDDVDPFAPSEAVTPFAPSEPAEEDDAEDALASQWSERQPISTTAPVAPRREPRPVVTFRDPAAAIDREETPRLATGSVTNGDTWIVERGDTLWSIAKDRYGSAEYFKALVKWNAAQFPDASTIRPGAVVKTPGAQVLEEAYPEYFTQAWKAEDSFDASFRASSTAEKPGMFRGPSGEKLYRVAPADSLFSIARKTLGRGGRWKEILELNRQSLPDPNRLSPGMVLRLPATAVADDGVYSAQSELPTLRR